MSAVLLQTRTKPLVGGTAQGGNPAGSIIVPHYETHADQIFSGTPSALDDHFDGTTLNAKWTTHDSGGANFIFKQLGVAGSKLNIAGYSNSASDNFSYTNQVSGSLPNVNDFTLTIRIDTCLSVQWYSGSWAYFDIQLFNGPNNCGVVFRLDAIFAASNKIYYGLSAYCGVGPSTLFFYCDSMPFPKYLRYQWTLASRAVGFYYSYDGVTFERFSGIPAASSGFTSGVDPLTVWLFNAYRNGGTGLTQIDWIKFTNP